jgi:hypothetical protein
MCGPPGEPSRRIAARDTQNQGLRVSPVALGMPVARLRDRRTDLLDG